MADVETPAAEPSPAATTATTETPATAVSVPTDPEAYAEWRQTGKVPEGKDDKPSKREHSASSKSSVDEESEKGAPVSETGTKGRENAETRIKRLVSERDSYKARLEALETGKKDDKAESSTAPVKGDKAESPTAPELKRPTKPKQEDFDSWSEYETAQDKYLEDLADFKAAERLEAHTQKLRQEAVTAEMQKRLDSAKERYGAEAETTIITTAKTIFDHAKVAPAIKAALGRSDVIVDALYVMGSDAEELSDFLNLSQNDPIEALRKWFTVEALVKQELSGNPGKAPAESGTPARGEDGKFLPAKPAKRIEAPSPPRELNGNAAPGGDERERAVKTGDFRTFKADADRRDIARFRGQ